MNNISNRFTETFKPYSFRNWNDKLFEVSQPYFEVRIDTIELITLVTNQHKFLTEERSLDEFKFFKELKELVEREFKGEKFFSKFFTRSAKDVSDPVYDCPYEMVYAFLSSMRVFEDMCVVRKATENLNEIVIYLRPYMEFEKVEEYRLFYVNGIVSVSSYHKLDEYDLEESDNVDEDILKWNREKVMPYVGVGDYCIDLIRQEDKITLIEVNPYHLSDPIFLSHDQIPEKSKQVTYRVE